MAKTNGLQGALDAKQNVIAVNSQGVRLKRRVLTILAAHGYTDNYCYLYHHYYSYCYCYCYH